MRVQFGHNRKVGEIMKVWDDEGNVARFDGDGLKWLKAQIAKGENGKYKPAKEETSAKPEPKKKVVATKAKPKKRGLLG